MPDFPGTGRGIGNPLPSGDPVLPTNLIDPATMSKIRDLMSTEQMKLLVSTDTQAKFDKIVEKMLQTLVVKSLGNIERKTAATHPLTQIASQIASQNMPPGTPAGLQPGVQPAPSSPQYTTPVAPPQSSSSHPRHLTPAPPEGTPSAPGRVPTIREQFGEGRSQTMSGIGRKAAGVVQKAVSQRTPNWDVEEETGDLVKYTGALTPDGKAEVGDRISKGAPGFARTYNRVRLGRTIADSLGRASTGEGLLGMGRLGMMVGRSATGIGLVTAGTEVVGRQLESQRAKAAPYRQAFGDQGTGSFAASDRIGEFMAGISGFGTIGGDRARQDYQMASSLGLRGASRDAATGFARDMNMKYGMGADDTFAIVRQALESGNVSLTDYAESIHKVTKAAVDGGRSAADATKELMAAQRIITQNLGGGTASLGTATNITTAVSGMDRQTAIDVGGAPGLARLASDPNMIRMSAISRGQDPQAAQYLAGAGGIDEVKQNNTTLSGVQDMIVTRFANAVGIAESRIRSDANGITSRTAQQKIFLGWFSGDLDRANIASQTLMALIQGLGMQANSQEEARAILFEAANKGFTKGANLSGGGTIGGAVSGHKLNGTMLSYGKATGLGSAGISGQNQSAFVAGGGDQGSQSAAAYLRTVDKTGKGDSLLETLLNTKTEKDLEAFSGHGIDSTKFRVLDKNGKPVKGGVDLATIMGSADYRSQLNADTIVYGKGNGQKTIGDFTNKQGSKSSAKGGSQQVTIKFTGAAERLLQVAGPTAAERSAQPGSGDYNPDQSPYSGQ